MIRKSMASVAVLFAIFAVLLAIHIYQTHALHEELWDIANKDNLSVEQFLLLEHQTVVYAEKCQMLSKNASEREALIHKIRSMNSYVRDKKASTYILLLEDENETVRADVAVITTGLANDEAEADYNKAASESDAARHEVSQSTRETIDYTYSRYKTKEKAADVKLREWGRRVGLLNDSCSVLRTALEKWQRDEKVTKGILAGLLPERQFDLQIADWLTIMSPSSDVIQDFNPFPHIRKNTRNSGPQ